MLDVVSQSPLGDSGRRLILEDPALRQLASERYPAPLAERRGVPRPAGLAPTPAPDIRMIDADGACLQLRLRSTHDVHHAVLGLPVTVAGEAAGSASAWLWWSG